VTTEYDDGGFFRRSPNRRWNHKGPPSEMTAVVDVRAAVVKPNLSAAALFMPIVQGR